MSVFIRPVNLDDMRQIFEWRNDPFIVARSSSQCAVSLKEHRVWFDHILVSKEVLPFIVEIFGQSAGHLRFDLEDDGVCLITAYLLSAYTGKGYGVESIRQGCELARQEWPSVRVMAQVREENLAGRSAFLKAGFKPQAAGQGHLTFWLGEDSE
jgi:RimJ/RimL family protein N-acetyltransferase